MTATDQRLAATLEPVAEAARRAGVFGAVRLEPGMLVCEAAGSAEPAFYRVRLDDGRLWVELVMKDRWLSESIEAELMHTGDSLEELLDEELAEQGYEGAELSFEHFRSPDMLFTFRSAVPADLADPEAERVLTQCLLAYQACFVQLGDMGESEDG